MRTQGISTLEDTMQRPATFRFFRFERERKFSSLNRNLFIQGNKCESKKRNNKIM